MQIQGLSCRLFNVNRVDNRPERAGVVAIMPAVTSLPVHLVVTVLPEVLLPNNASVVR